MSVFMERGGPAREAESVGLMTEGAAGIAIIVLAIIGLANVSSPMLASIVTIVIGAGLMVEAFNATAEEGRALSAATGAAAGEEMAELGGRAMIDLMVGLTGLVLGILGVLGINAVHLVPAALIVYGGGLLLSGAIGARSPAQVTGTVEGQTRTVSYGGSAAASGFKSMVGIAAAVLGILAVIAGTAVGWVLTLVGFIAVGAALLMTSATFTGSVMRLFTAGSTEAGR